MAVSYGEQTSTYTIENANETNVKIITFKYYWTIHNFSLLNLKAGQVVDSPVFPERSIYELKYCLKLYPRGNIIDYKDYISLFLCLKSSNINKTFISFQLCILDENHGTKFKKGTPDDKLLTRGDPESGWSNFLRRSFLLNKVNGLLQNDKLIILCEISFSLFDHFSISLTVNNSTITDSHLSDDFELMFKNQEFSDVTLAACGEEFRAHKCILAARSSVFKSMFHHNMKEAQQNFVEIEDIKPKVFKELLRFIYTGKVCNLEEVVCDLLIAADKYGLEMLKKICGNVLCKSLSVENVIRTYILADFLGMVQIKASTIEFLNAHIKKVIVTNEWKSLIQMHPHLVTEAYIALSTSQIPEVAKDTRRIVYFINK